VGSESYENMCTIKRHRPAEGKGIVTESLEKSPRKKGKMTGPVRRKEL